MSPESIEQGYHEDFLCAVFDLIQDRNTRMVPTSPTIAKFVRKNKRKYKDLLPVGISI